MNDIKREHSQLTVLRMTKNKYTQLSNERVSNKVISEIRQLTR